jgi:sporulation protein YlmC with PRC-barrel domain
MDIDIPMDASVECADGVCGRSVYLVINPVKQKVTHLVVEEAQLPYTERLVPIEWVAQTTANLIRLKCTREELAKQEPFSETEYVKPDSSELSVSPVYLGAPYIDPYMDRYYVWPYAIPDVRVEHKHVPPGELAVRRGAHVEATDGKVGRVDEFLVDPETEYITHLVLREGHLWGQKDVIIPVSDIDHIEEDTVYVKLDKHGIEALPAIPIHRWGF